MGCHKVMSLRSCFFSSVSCLTYRFKFFMIASTSSITELVCNELHVAINNDSIFPHWDLLSGQPFFVSVNQKAKDSNL